MSVSINFPTVHTARRIGLPWGGKDASLYPASIGHRHPGCDLYAPKSPPVLAIADGTVVWAGYEQAHGYGRHITLAHEINGIKFRSGYAHLRDIAVAEGDFAPGGKRIATMGGDLRDRLRGASRGPHLHFEVILADQPDDRDFIKTYRGYTVDPLRWLADTFLPAARYVGRVEEARGVRLRLFPEVSRRATQVGALAYGEECGFSEIHRDDDNIWLRLNGIRNVWAAALYGGKSLISFSETGAQAEDNNPPPASALLADVAAWLEDSEAWIAAQATWIADQKKELAQWQK